MVAETAKTMAHVVSKTRVWLGALAEALTSPAGADARSGEVAETLVLATQLKLAEFSSCKRHATCLICTCTMAMACLAALNKAIEGYLLQLLGSMALSLLLGSMLQSPACMQL